MTRINSIDILSNGSISPSHVQARGYDLLYVLPEYDVTGMSRPELNGASPDIYGLPATVPLLEINTVSIFPGDDTYKLLWERFRIHCPSGWSNQQVTGKLNAYLKNGVAFTDHNLEWHQIVTCGNVLYPTGNTKSIGGEGYYEILQLKSDTYARMKARLSAFPYLETYATISNRGYGGRGRSWFPQCGDTKNNSVPALLLCKQETNWIKSSRVRMLRRDEPIPSLYYP